MRTTISIPDGLFSELEQFSEGRPKTKIICEALEQYIKQKRRERLLSLRGKLSVKDVSRELEAAELKDAKRLEQRLRRRRHNPLG